MSLASEILLSLLVVSGGVFTFIGSLGLWRLRDFYTRLHGPTKATTLGVGCLLIASSIHSGLSGDGLSVHEILVSLFLFITAPVSAHLLAKAALHRRLESLAALPHDPAPPPTHVALPDRASPCGGPLRDGT
ncbi:MAG: Na+/H+ antiporter subunit G [Sulfuritalea sp.]|nr:Na+/H+ antiporter subunit G [Sulfuritalea sp.]